MLSQQPEALCRCHDVRNGDRRDGDLGAGLDGEDGREQAADPEARDGRDAGSRKADERDEGTEEKCQIRAPISEVQSGVIRVAPGT
jgi:hypothetical protein